MHPVQQTFLAFLIILLIIHLTSIITSFFQIKFNAYMNYIMFILCLVFFYIILPRPSMID